MSEVEIIKKMIREAQYDQAEAEISRLKEGEANIGRILHARILQMKGQVDEAYQTASLALEDALERKNLIEQVCARREMAVSNWVRGDWEATMACVQGAEQAADQLEKDQKQAIWDCMGALNNIKGKGYESQDMFETAVRYYMKSYFAYRNAGEPLGASRSLADIGNLYRRLEMFDGALKYFHEAAEVINDALHVRERAKVWKRIGQIYEEMGKMGKAHEAYERSLGLFKLYNSSVSGSN